ncbi:putative DUF1997 family protein [Thalictrum thalictroides]|uniref:Putative DUF1997 family protein n=1 Tax=Thalictrum thalictroides TaxID=46969 RepID=A0A7J6W5H2_THATH|nr:putative DUF1997 family protein [Thalictrum thalictroides]
MELYQKCSIAIPTPSSDINTSRTFITRAYRAFRKIPSYPTNIREFKIQLRSRTRAEVIQDANTQAANVNVKIANLVARRKERLKLPDHDDESQKLYPFSDFLSQPSGLESILNTKALEDFQFLESNTYRCILPKIKLLKFEVAPMVELRVTPTSEDCTVEMLSCKFEGSEAVERQNDRFSAFMRNHITWNTDGERYLDVDMNLNISLEVYTRPFTILPVSAIEKPGNIVLQSLVDKLVPLLLQQLLQDYETWVQEQCNASP